MPEEFLLLDEFQIDIMNLIRLFIINIKLRFPLGIEQETVLILIFAEVLGLYGMIILVLLSQEFPD